MDIFIQKKREKKTEKTVIDSGLWKWSRHPNYLGELLFWWGMYTFSLSDSNASPSWIVVGPLLLTFLLSFVSIKLMEDRQIEHKKEAFVNYQREVGSALLLFPPFVNRKLGLFLYPLQAQLPATVEVDD